MSAKDLKELLEHLDDTHELVLGAVAGPEAELPFPVDELLFCWRDAADEAACALQQWRERPRAGPPPLSARGNRHTAVVASFRGCGSRLSCERSARSWSSLTSCTSAAPRNRWG